MNRAIQLYPDRADLPEYMAVEAEDEYRAWSQKIRAGGNLGFPWSGVSQMVGPILPGWLILIGGRAKAGKSTFLREVFHSWVTDFGKRVLYVGTEQSAGILKGLWACLRLRLPQEAAINPSHPGHEAVLADFAEQTKLADQAMIVAEPAITIDIFTQWARYAYTHKCDALIFDHFHRLEDGGQSQHRSRNAAIREIKNVASQSSMAVVVAAQLINGEGGALGEYEVPGCHSWAETAGLRRECDVALQLWRPFQPGITREQKSSARDDVAKLSGLVQENIMAVRCDAHRYREVSMTRATRLYVNQGELSSVAL
jgi:hypothetical protein